MKKTNTAKVVCGRAVARRRSASQNAIGRAITNGCRPAPGSRSTPHGKCGREKLAENRDMDRCDEQPAGGISEIHRPEVRPTNNCRPQSADTAIETCALQTMRAHESASAPSAPPHALVLFSAARCSTAGALSLLFQRYRLFPRGNEIPRIADTLRLRRQGRNLNK
jgi:hypothetical protein